MSNQQRRLRNRDQCYPDAWLRHQMETFSPLLAICAGNSLVSGEFLAQRPVTRSFDVFFDLCPNKRLSKQTWGWWYETPSGPLWRHRWYTNTLAGRANLKRYRRFKLWGENFVTEVKFSSPTASLVFKITTSSAAKDHNFVNMKIFPFQWNNQVAPFSTMDSFYSQHGRVITSILSMGWNYFNGATV